MSSALPVADEPIFYSADQALRFAFGMRSPLIDSAAFLASLFTKRKRPRGLGLLSPEERIAQAAMILAFIERMHLELQASLLARYTLDWRRTQAQRYLADAVMPRIGGVTHRRMVYELVARHHGKLVRLGDLAVRFHLHANTITAKRARVEDLLRSIESQADDSIGTYLVDGGLIEGA